MKNYLTFFLIILAFTACRNNHMGSRKTKDIDENEIKKIFSAKVYMFLSIGNSNNDYHNHLHMFKDDSGTPFFPIYTSKDKILETEMVMPDDLPFDGILVALMAFDDMTYVINYSLEDEIVITGKDLKKILHTEIEKFKSDNPEIMEGIILKN